MKKIFATNLLAAAFAAALMFSALPAGAATIDASGSIPVTVTPKRTASPKLLACAADWKTAKADEAIRTAGWITFWSACAKRRAAEFPSKSRSVRASTAD